MYENITFRIGENLIVNFFIFTLSKLLPPTCAVCGCWFNMSSVFYKCSALIELYCLVIYWLMEDIVHQHGLRASLILCSSCNFYCCTSTWSHLVDYPAQLAILHYNWPLCFHPDGWMVITWKLCSDLWSCV